MLLYIQGRYAEGTTIDKRLSDAMSGSKKRHTQINLNGFEIRRSRILGPENTENSKDTTYRQPPGAPREGPFKDRRRSGVEATNVNKRHQLARPSSFPINVKGIVKTGTPWHEFNESYRIRFGLDYRVIVAERRASPFDIVAIRTFTGEVKNTEAHILESIQHENFARMLHLYQASDLAYIVSEHAHVSLHEISRSRAKITKMELAAILGQVGPHAVSPLAHVLTLGAGQWYCVPSNSGPST